MNFKPTTLALLIASLSTAAWAAESTNVGEIKVQGTGSFAGGKMVQEETPKARATVTKKAIEEKAATSNPYQLIDKLPGVNSHSQDATGLFGGTMTVRGFSSSQMGVTVDGAPMNDSGSYDVFPQEYVDAENLEEVYVTQGTTDNDAPHVGAVGGNLGLVSQNPTDKFRFRLNQSFGDDHFYKTFFRIDTGKTGPLKSFISVSKAESDKFRGNGQADRLHIDGKTVWNIGGGSQLSADMKYNKADNHFLRRARMSDWKANRYYDYDKNFAGRIAKFDTADNESALTNYFELNRNPFENYIATLKANFQLSPNLRLDIEPYFWYGFGGGSSGTTLFEGEFRNVDKAGKVTYSCSATGFTTGCKDLNGDGDRLDRVLAYAISKTVTHRPGVTTKLNWNLGDHKLMAGFWYEDARHRQTRPHVKVDANGVPVDIWANDVITRNDNQEYNGFSGGLARNWRTNTTVTQFMLQDTFNLGDNFNFVLGLRAPKTEREGISYGAGSESEQAKFLSDRKATNEIRVKRSWDQVLPNVSAKYTVNDQSHVYAALSRNFRAPANFTLYEIMQYELTSTPKIARDLEPETSTNIDIGYRYQGELFNFNGQVFHVDFKNRQQQTVDADGNRRNYNVGDARKVGLELEVGTRPVAGFSFYGTASIIRDRILDNYETFDSKSVKVSLPTEGKQMADTPKKMVSLGMNYQNGGFTLGFSGKYTSKRWADLMNTESAPSLTVWDLNMGYRFANGFGMKSPTIRLALSNLFDKNYLAGIPGTQINAFAYQTIGGNAPNYDIGAPRYTSVTFSADF